MKSICVFCGSSLGNAPQFEQLAQKLGKEIAQNNRQLVYGGANVGLMGVLANSCLQAGGEVIGVIPQSISNRELAHQNLTKLYTVESMHDRKKLMYELSSAFLAIPGGFGTLDELFEILTWKQLGFHQKPIFVLNEDKYFEHLILFLEQASRRGYISPEHLQFLKPVQSLSEFWSSLGEQ